MENYISSKIDELNKFLKNEISCINDKITKRSRKIHANDLILFLTNVVGSGNSFINVLNGFKLNDQLNVSKQAIIKKLNLLPVELLQNLNNKLINFVYEPKEVRLLATDGTITYYPKSFVNHNFPLTQNKHSCKLLINAIIDVKTGIPIHYQPNKDYSERKALITQIDLNCLREKDIILLDRGYYSHEIVDQLINKNIKSVFRLTKHCLPKSAYIEFNKYDDILVKLKYSGRFRFLRVLKFTIDKKSEPNNTNIYYIGTTLYDKKKYPIDEIIKLYKERWNIETHFRYVKYELGFQKMSGMSELRVLQLIEINRFIMILACYIESLLKQYIDNKKYKINTSNCIQFIWSEIIPIICSKDTNVMQPRKSTQKIQTKKILRIITIILNTLVCIQKNRHYPRIRKRPQGKWGLSGTTSHRPH